MESPKEKIGIEKIKDILKFSFSLGDAFEKALADGKFQWEDSGHFLPVFIQAGNAFDNIKDVVQEIKDLDADEVNELHSFIVKEFDIENNAIEGFIESGLGLALNIYNLVTKVFAYKKSKKEVSPQVE